MLLEPDFRILLVDSIRELAQTIIAAIAQILNGESENRRVFIYNFAMQNYTNLHIFAGISVSHFLDFVKVDTWFKHDSDHKAR